MVHIHHIVEERNSRAGSGGLSPERGGILGSVIWTLVLSTPLRNIYCYNMVINAEVANVGKPNLCDWPRLWSASSLIGHVFKCGLDKERVDN